MQSGANGEPIVLARSLRVAEVLAARLCHDLAGPVGTIAASLALSDEDEASAAEARSIAAEAADAAIRRVRLLRAAWGPAAPLKIADIEMLAEALRRPQVAVDIAGDPGAVVAAPTARVLLNVLLLAAESLPRGGHVGMSTGDEEFLIAIDGPRAAWPEHFARYLVDPDAAWGAFEDPGVAHARAMLAPLTALLARGAGLRLSLLLSGSAAPAPLLLSAHR